MFKCASCGVEFEANRRGPHKYCSDADCKRNRDNERVKAYKLKTGRTKSHKIGRPTTVKPSERSASLMYYYERKAGA